MVGRSYVFTSRAVGAGIVGTVVLWLFLAGSAPLLGLGKLDYPRLLGTFLSGVLDLPTSKLWFLAGSLLFLVGGIAWALIYASYLCDRLLGPGWLQGLTYGGLGVFLVSSLLFFPLMSLAHPLVRSGQMPAPGFFGLGLSGSRVALANFLGHCLFGIVMGVIYRRRLVFT